MLRAVEDEYPEVRQAAAYGFGVMALKGDSEFVPALAAALGPLCNCIARYVLIANLSNYQGCAKSKN